MSETNASLANHDLRPTTPEQRTWTWVHYAALWIGMAHCVPTWLMAGSFIALGLSWWQVILLMAVGNCIVLIPIVLNSHPGTRYGIPFPVLARASFGTLGANVPALVRGIIAAVWFGIQIHIGGGALKMLLLQIAPGIESVNATQILSYGVIDWLCFAIFMAFNLLVLKRGMASLKRFELWAAPLVMVFAIAMCIWACIAAGGLGPVVHASEHPNVDLGRLIPKALMSVIGFWSTLALNAPDFSRFAKSQRDQAIGQALGLPTTMVAFSVLAVFTSSAMAVLYGKVIWDPLEMIKHLPSGFLSTAALIGILIATVCVNVPANLVSPSYDFSNVAPKRISMWQGALVTAAIATAIMPWRLLATAQDYVFAWLGTSSDLLGPVAGILIADYWLVRKHELDVEALYQANGEFRYANGFNPNAVVALAAGIGAALIGRFVPSLQFFSDIGWVTGFFVGLGVYVALPRRVRPTAVLTPV